MNTGKFIGNTDSLEDTVFETNLLAAKEVARQARLRNLGGIIVVDFIDMEKPEHRTAVVEALKEALQNDRAKCNVSETSGLGLVQFTRKKSKDDNTVMLTKTCPYCKGSGTVLSDTYIAFKIKIALKNCFARGYENAVIELNAGIFAQIIAEQLEGQAHLHDPAQDLSRRTLYRARRQQQRAQFARRGKTFVLNAAKRHKKSAFSALFRMKTIL